MECQFTNLSVMQFLLHVAYCTVAKRDKLGEFKQPVVSTHLQAKFLPDVCRYGASKQIPK